MRVNASILVIMAMILGVICGCSVLPKEPSVADPRSVYAWPVAKCPSSAAVPRPAIAPAIVAGLATPLLTDLVSGLVGVPVSAIQNAATADTTGFKATGQNPRSYFPNVTVDSSTNPPQYKFTPPGCYVVAYTRFVPSGRGPAGGWCGDSGFAASVPDACTAEGGPILKTVETRSDPGDLQAAVPDFYAEIELVPSDYQLPGVTIARPRVIALHYPKSLVEPKSAKPRLVTINLNLTSPGSSASDPVKASSLGIVLQGVTPNVPIAEGSLASQQTSWIAMPTNGTALGANLPQPKGGPYFPVNISATLSEVGDPSIFLQAFAKAVAGSAADYSKAIVSAVPPIPTASTEQQSANAKAALQSAIAQVAADEAKYASTCSPAPATPAAKATANAAYQAVLADRIKANAAALGIASPYDTAPSIPYGQIDQGLSKCF